MKRFCEKLKKREEREKEYRYEKELLDRKHGKYRPPRKRMLLNAVSLSIKFLLVIGTIPIVSGGYLIATNPYMMDMMLSSKGESRFEREMAKSLEKSMECLNIDSDRYPKEKKECLIEAIGAGDTFLVDYIVTGMATELSLETRDKELAEITMEAMSLMSDYRHYDDIILDQEIGRGFRMMFSSIFFLPLRPFDVNDALSIEENTFVDKKMAHLEENREKLEEAFDL